MTGLCCNEYDAVAGRKYEAVGGDDGGGPLIVLGEDRSEFVKIG